MGLSTIRKPSDTVRHGSLADRSRSDQASNADSDHKPSKSPPTPHTSQIYRNLAPVYGMVWPIFARRNIQDSIKAMRIAPGAKVLEVGVGTGLSLPAYPRHAEVTGVDLSEDMLAKAKERIDESGWTNITVQPMNAEELDFPDASFDIVTSFHVVSVVSNPKRMMSELTRVCRPGGRILIINHFRSAKPWIARMVDSAGSVTRHLGWRTDLRFDDVVAELPLRMDRRSKPSPVSLFTVMSATKLNDAS